MENKPNSAGVAHRSAPTQGGEGATGLVASAKRVPSAAARRALEEASARRAAIDARAAEIARMPERHGRGGLEPVRYQDWEVGGRAIDF